MSQSAWPDPATFDVDADALPSAVADLVARPHDVPAAILLLAGAEARRVGWAGRAAVEVAVALSAAGRQATLVDLGFEAPDLHTLLGGANLEGIADHFLFGVSLGQVAVPAGGFRFIPPGAYVPEPQDVLRHARWSALVREVDAAGQGLLLYAPVPGQDLTHLASHCGAAIVLAAESDRAEIEAALPGGLPVIAHLAPPAAAQAGAVLGGSADVDVPGDELAEEPWDDLGVAAEGGGDELDSLIDQVQAEGRAEREPGAASGGRRVGAVVAVLFVVVVLALVAWMGSRRTSEPQESAGTPAGEDAGLAATGGEVGSDRTGETTASAPGQPSRGTTSAAAAGAAPVETAIPYSVAIEAHPDMNVAQRRVDALRTAVPDLQFYVAPVLVERVVYYRVLAGPTADASSAQALMRRLVAERHKMAEEAWAIRPTTMAFHLGDFETQEAARERERELREAGVPSYVVELPLSSGTSRYRLYAGAYESAVEAEVLDQLLQAAGVRARLIERIGRPAA